MAKFKVGDRVRCVSSANINMQVDMVFTVKALTHNHWVEFQEIGGGCWYPQRFELVEEPPKTTPHIHAALIKAWADGAKIECRYHPKGEWFDTESPSWNLTNEYRIKPEPKPQTIREYKLFDDGTAWEAPMNANIRATFDGETGKLKSVEMI